MTTFNRLLSIKNNINHLLESISKLNNVIHYSHHPSRKITPSINELYERDPDKALEVLKDIQRRGHKRKDDYLIIRNKIEEYMRSQFNMLNMKPLYKYPTYCILDMKPLPSLFKDESYVKIPITNITKHLTFTIGDSFPVLYHRATNEYSKKSYPFGDDIISYDDIMNIDIDRVWKDLSSSKSYIEC